MGIDFERKKSRTDFFVPSKLDQVAEDGALTVRDKDSR